MEKEVPFGDGESEDGIKQDRKLELSNELKAEILKNVRDIHESDIGYSATPKANVGHILKEGFLGNDDHPHTIDPEAKKHAWITSARARNIHKNVIWFNITDRNYSEKVDFYFGLKIGVPAILFDLSTFEELSEGAYSMRSNENKVPFSSQYTTEYKNRFGESPAPRPRTFAVTGYDIVKAEIEPFEIFNKQEGKNIRSSRKVDTTFGFETPFRINPRLFIGLVVHDTSEEYVGQIAQMMLENKKDGRVLPIYDNAGNLLWPTRLSREQIKNNITESDTKKAKEIEKWKAELEFVVSSGSYENLIDYHFPNNIADLCPEIMSESNAQRRLAEMIILNGFLSNSNLKYGYSLDNTQRLIKQFNIQQKALQDTVSSHEQQFVDGFAVWLKQSSLEEFGSKIANLKELFYLDDETKKRLVYTQQTIEQVIEKTRYSRSREKLTELLATLDFVKNEGHFTDEELKEMLFDFMHNNYIVNGSDPEVAHWLVDNYKVTQQELSEKCMLDVSKRIMSRYVYGRDDYSIEDYLAIYPRDAFLKPKNQKAFLSAFESVLSLSTSIGGIVVSPKPLFELFGINYQDYFSSQRFYAVIVSHLRERAEKGGVSDKSYYESKRDRLFESLNKFIGEGLVFDVKDFEKDVRFPEGW